MRFVRSTLMAVAALGLAVAVAAMAVGPAAPIAAAADDLRSTITVVGEGRVTVQPDTAYASFGVEAAGDSFAATQNDASARMQAVIDTLVGQGISRDDIRTSRLAVNPVYDQRDNTVLRGYRANNTVRVRVRQLDRVGAIVDAATGAGANRVEGISFTVDNLEPVKDQAREQAVRNARAKADQLAGLVGMRIVGVKAVVESDASSSPAPYARADGALAAAPAAAPPVEPGTQEVRTQVTVTYIVE